MITDWLTVLGNHFPVIVIGCIEMIVAVVLAGYALKERRRPVKSVDTKTAEKIFLKELGHREEEAGALVRRKDMMPVYGSENLKDLIGVGIKDLQKDIQCIGRQMMSLEEAKRIWNRYRRWDGAGCFTAQMKFKSEEWMWMLIRRSEGGAYDVFTFYRITEFCEKLESYEKEIDELEEASQSKTTFLSRMSHEIRTPMNGIIGTLALAEGKLDEDHPAMQYLKRADQLSDHLLSLINDILDMSRIEAGKVELEEKVFSLRALGKKLYDMFSRELEAKGVQYSVDFQEMTVDYVIGDELRLSQVVINLLSNAVKFTSEGSVGVTFRQMMRQDGIVDLMIRVQDTGIGMKPEFIHRIFRPFEQEGIETSRKYGGSGLGMAITDQIIRLMGGEILVKSALGEGSEFTIFLHLPEAAAPEIGEVVQAENIVEDENLYEHAFRGRRILMAEDNELNAMIAVEILQEMEAEVELAGNGKEAVEMFESHPAGYYDFILMDVQMPVMDGREATRKIRGLERKDAGKIPIFALSADAFVEDERISIENGMDGHYAKPVDFKALQRNIGAFLQKREG